MFSQKTKLQLCAKNLTSVERDLVEVTYPTDLVGAVNDGTPPVIGDTVVTVDGFGGGDIPTGCIIGFAGDDTTYYVSTGGSATSITVDPPLRTNLSDDQAVTIYPHFDITDYWTNDVEIGQQAEFTQAEMIFDRPIKIELFNQNSIFYDRDTHSTGWGSTTAYFSTYNAQADTDNQYIRISLKRNGTWYQKYNGKIIQHTLELDEINHKVSFECESVFYGLKDNLVAQIEGLYNLHKYTTTTRKTKTPSGFYVDVIKTLFQSVGIQDKAFAVTYKEKSLTNSTCTLTTSATHNIVAGESITVSIGDNNFDGRHIVYSVTSNTITYPNNKDPYDYKKDDVAAGVLAGNTAVDVQVGFTPTTQYAYLGKCKFSGHNTIYTFWNDDGNSITVSPALTNNVALNEDVFFSYPTYVSSTAASGTVTAHRIYFDSATDYFNVTHQGHSYNLLDLMWITEKWIVEDVESETSFNLMNELCQQLLALACIDYKAGIAYGYFRSKLNTSASKFTISNTAGTEPIAAPRLMGNWPFYSPDGIVAKSTVNFWAGQSQETAFCYAEDLGAGDYQRYLSETPTSAVLAYERYSGAVAADSFNSLTVGDKIQIRDDDTIYTVMDISGDAISVLPKLRKSVRRGDKFWKVSKKTLNIKYSNLCNLKLKYPNIFLADSTAKTIRKYYNKGTATLGIHPMSYYTSEVIYTNAYDVLSVAFIKNVPCADGYLSATNGDLLCFADTPDGGSNYYVYTIKSRKDYPNTGKYTVYSTGYTDILGKLQSGYIESRSTDDNSVQIYNMLLIGLNNLFDVSNTLVRRLNFELNNAGDAAVFKLKGNRINVPISIVNGTPSGNISGYSNVNLDGTIRGFSSITANANEFGLYKLELGTTNKVFSITSGAIGGNNAINSMFLNHDILNPDYDNLVYADAGHAQSIRKGEAYNSGYSSASNVFTGTSPGASVVYNFIVNHGEGANQEYYYCLSTDGTILKNAGTAWSSSSVIMPTVGGGGGGFSYNSLWGASSPIGVNTTNVKIIRKAYDNFLVIADPTALRLLVVDIEKDLMIYIEDTTVLDSIGDIDIQCFTNWWDYQGATNANIFENDICSNASKLAYKFYSKNRRPYECRLRDVDLGYIDYILFDRVTISSNILSAASGSPKFYVYGYSIDCRTHDHKLTLLESVE